MLFLNLLFNIEKFADQYGAQMYNIHMRIRSKKSTMTMDSFSSMQTAKQCMMPISTYFCRRYSKA